MSAYVHGFLGGDYLKMKIQRCQEEDDGDYYYNNCPSEPWIHLSLHLIEMDFPTKEQFKAMSIDQSYRLGPDFEKLEEVCF